MISSYLSLTRKRSVADQASNSVTGSSNIIRSGCNPLNPLPPKANDLIFAWLMPFAFAFKFMVWVLASSSNTPFASSAAAIALTISAERLASFVIIAIV